MEKILAIAVLVVFVWLAIPHLIQGQWIAPTAVSPNSWVTNYDTTGNAEAAATPPEGYGWFHFDFWNHPTTAGTPVTSADTHLRSPSQEFRR